MAGFVYIHVPKCGGSSFGAALRLRFIMSQASISLNQGRPELHGTEYILSDYAQRDTELKNLMSRKVKMISGHVRFGRALENAPEQGYQLITLLRNPMERFISHYNYLQHKHPSPTRPNTLEAFLATEDAARLASQYLFYFGRNERSIETNANEKIKHAIHNLSKFSLVGDLASIEDFSTKLSRLIGTPLPKWRRNKAPVPTFIPLQLADRISALCAADIQIYEAMQTKQIAA